MSRQDLPYKSRPWRLLELNGGQVTDAAVWRFVLPAGVAGYADAQLDDYGVGRRGRRFYPWRRGTRMALAARFSQPQGTLLGTAGFGFWNAPFADPTIRWPALPQAVWFFYASAPTDLPLAVSGAGRGWFAATLDATTPTAVSLLPLAPWLLLLNQSQRLQQRIWPWLRLRLGISFQPLEVEMTAWHTYALDWLPDGCRFYVDEALVLQTTHSPRGPLGFVCWLDNQYLVATVNGRSPHGRLQWGTLPIPSTQVMEVRDLTLTHR